MPSAPRYARIENPQPGMLVVWTRPFGSDRRSMAVLVKPDPVDNFYWHIITETGKTQIALRIDFYHPEEIDPNSPADPDPLDEIDTLEGLSAADLDRYYDGAQSKVWRKPGNSK